MDHNPYTPPAAPVADASEPLRPVERPRQVDRAVRLLWIVLALGVVNSALQWRVLAASPASLATILLVQALGIGIAAWLTIKISGGRNWARITYLVMAVIGLPMIVLSLPATFNVSPISGVVTLVQIGLQITALYLVFSEPGREWFRRPALTSPQA